MFFFLLKNHHFRIFIKFTFPLFLQINLKSFFPRIANFGTAISTLLRPKPLSGSADFHTIHCRCHAVVGGATAHTAPGQFAAEVGWADCCAVCEGIGGPSGAQIAELFGEEKVQHRIGKSIDVGEQIHKILGKDETLKKTWRKREWMMVEAPVLTGSFPCCCRSTKRMINPPGVWEITGEKNGILGSRMG